MKDEEQASGTLQGAKNYPAFASDENRNRAGDDFEIRNGERVPLTETLIILADFFGVSIDYILCRTDKPEINR